MKIHTSGLAKKVEQGFLSRGMKHPNFREAAAFWCKLGWLSFGGPAGQIALLHEEIVSRKKWLTERQFLHGLNFCMLLPGPEAQQLVTYIGWKMHGLRGGLTAGGLFILPGVLTLWALGWLFVTQGETAWVAAIFQGLIPAVLAIILAATFRIGQRTLRHPFLWAVSAAAFVGIFFLKIAFPWLILGAALLSVGLRAVAPEWAGRLVPVHNEEAEGKVPKRKGQRGHVARVVGWGLLIWWLPIALTGWATGWDSIWTRMGAFFSKTALMTFGGAYAVLAYVAQQAVEKMGWLTSQDMMMGLALAETTPGPLILTLQFVGFVGGWNHAGGLGDLGSATLAAGITTWATFAPSFILVLAAAPFIEGLGERKGLTLALTFVSAAVVGVIFNLAAWFGIHALITAEGAVKWLPAVLTGIYLILLLRFRLGPAMLVGLGAVVGLVTWWLRLG